MRQQDLARMLGAPASSPSVSWPKEGVEVFDLFSGAGGFSQGAVQAGHRVVFACDFDADALATHERNHPGGCEHRCAALPLDDIPYPTDGRHFHLHGSPPCQKFSLAQHGTATEAQIVEGGESLVEWFLREALERSNCTTWSMEEVDSPRIHRILGQFRRKHRKRIDWDVFDFELLGVPQTRTRILAGTPALIVRLRQLRAADRIRSVRDTLKEPRGTHTKGTSTTDTVRNKSRLDEAGKAKFVYRTLKLHEKSRPISKPAHTLCAKLRTAGWFTMTPGQVAHDYKPFNIAEMAALQTFPEDYRWPKQVTHAARQIGNAVPPLIAQLLLSECEQQRR
jgi:DNA (cytosine-5)-methyltransferase 1